MEFAKLLGKKLKDDVVMEILEHYDMDVVYDFDRTHEGMEDVYWAASQENGFQFRFNENQLLDVIFLYMVPREGFTPIDKSEIDVPIYGSFLEAKSAFENNGVKFTNYPSEDPNDEWFQRWINGAHGTYTTHYEFKDKKLRMITLGLVNE
ncbi:MAG: hypothetical protein KZQ80_14495 [Candidatus Thiodiazotropha sp. (ex Monitilora ramsayi)]|nr:hypothetical protein [Candidatus Thiodiazotropha sp. (ex Monitilora ramsayi)]